MLKKKKFLIGGIIIVLALGFLGYSAFAGAATYYYKVNEVIAKGQAAVGPNLRIEGTVTTGTVQKGAAGRSLAFTISDNVSKAGIPVTYSGVIPDTFKEGTDVVVEGVLDSSGAFQATTIMTKCPSKYEAATQ